jgi:hypothetical protein
MLAGAGASRWAPEPRLIRARACLLAIGGSDPPERLAYAADHSDLLLKKVGCAVQKIAPSGEAGDRSTAARRGRTSFMPELIAERSRGTSTQWRYRAPWRCLGARPSPRDLWLVAQYADAQNSHCWSTHRTAPAFTNECSAGPKLARS